MSDLPGVSVKPGLRPLVSICIPVYNCEKHIGEAIQSVLHQTLPNFELIIVDNCSTDGTWDLVRRHRDPRIKSCRNEKNIGAEGNWNKAMSLATGKYVKLLCADDLIYPECLARQAAILEDPKNGGVELVCCARDIIDQDGRKILTRGFPHQGRLSGPQAIKRTIVSGTNLLGEPCAVMFRDDTVRKGLRFDISIPYIIDLDMWCRLMRNGDLYAMQDVLCAFRVSERSWSLAIENQSADLQRFISKIGNAADSPVNKIDILRGRLMAHLNRVLRLIFYKLFVGFQA